MLSHKKVNQIIATFEGQPNLPLPTLMEYAKVLSTQMYYYADLLGKVGKEYRLAYITRKKLFADLVKDFIGKGESATTAKISAEADDRHTEARKKEVQAESRYDTGRLMFKALENVLSRMNQEIAELRKEKEYQKHLQ